MSKKKRNPKTTGSEWLYHSLMAFNGSGYADREDAKDYLDSYRAYKLFRKEAEAVKLLDEYYDDMLPDIEKLLKKTDGAGRVAPEYFKNKVNLIKDQTKLI